MPIRATATSKGARTRARILDTSLRLFRERGYEQCTMRAIAEEAGVSLGNAYYYFGSKEHLIQAFYAQTHEQHLEACGTLLEQESSLKRRLLGVMQAKLRSIEPYHAFAGVLFKTAADPESPLNPFSAESRPVRAQSTALFARVVEGSNAKVTGRLRAELPHLLWLYHMGVILFWIHDRSPGCERSRRLVEVTVDLVIRLIALARLPILRPLIGRVFKLTDELRLLFNEEPHEAQRG